MPVLRRLMEVLEQLRVLLNFVMQLVVPTHEAAAIGSNSAHPTQVVSAVTDEVYVIVVLAMSETGQLMLFAWGLSTHWDFALAHLRQLELVSVLMLEIDHFVGDHP